MSPQFRPTPGAKGYQHSCTPVLSSIPLLATLELIDKVSFSAMLAKQRVLTGSLEELLRASKFHRTADSKADGGVGFKIITPEAPWRGTQISIAILPEGVTEGAGKGAMPRVFTGMLKRGLVGDEREPSVIRLSPVVLYNTYTEVGKAVEILEAALEDEAAYQKKQGSGEESSANLDMASKE